MPKPTSPTPISTREADVDDAHDAAPAATSEVEQHQSESSWSTWSIICCTVGSAGSSALTPALRGGPRACSLAARLAPLAVRHWLDERCQQDTRLVEDVQRYRLEQQRDRVAGQERRDGRRTRRSRSGGSWRSCAGVTRPRRVAPRITHGHLEDEAHRQQDRGGEAVELARLDEHVELARVEVHEEAHRRGQHDEVAEQRRPRRTGTGRRSAAASRRVARSA